MKKHSKTVKSMLKKLSAPVILIMGLVLGFVVDRVANLFAFPNHGSAAQAAEKPAPALAVCPQLPEQQARPAPRVAKVAHRKHAPRHAAVAAKKHKAKKPVRVASAK